MIGMNLLKRWTMHMATRSLSKTIILLYHRVNSLPDDPQKLCVSPENFEMHLRIIRDNFHPISLNQLCNDIKCKKITNRGIVITFDDGYADNLFNAKPILEKYGVPATVFAVSDWVDSQKEFFWDDLFRILIQTKELPSCLEIEINGKKHTWDMLDNCGLESAAKIDLSKSMWDVEMTDNPTPKHQAYREFVMILRDLEPKSREQVLSDLCKWAGINRNGRNNQRTLTKDEISVLEKGGLLEVGAHTTSHSRLSKLSANAQKLEIFNGKQQLERLIGHPVSSFSYPWGGHSDYNETSIKLVREAGFGCSCSNFPGSVHRWSDPFQLPRFIVRDWSGEFFERQINKFFDT